MALSYLFKALFPDLPFIDRMGIVFLASLTIAIALSLAYPAAKGRDRISTEGVSYATTGGFNIASGAVIAVLTAFYAAWW